MISFALNRQWGRALEVFQPGRPCAWRRTYITVTGIILAHVWTHLTLKQSTIGQATE